MKFNETILQAYAEKLKQTALSFPSQDWETKQSGKFFYFISKRYIAPGQGWKIHVSCLGSEVFRLLTIVIPFLKEEGISFKLLASFEDILGFNIGASGASQIGKVLTIYPKDTIQAYNLGKKLDSIWLSSKAPSPPSDLYFRSGGNVSLRYGAINNTQIITSDDHSVYPALVDPQGNLIPDVSSLNGSQVSWAPPLPDQLQPNEYFGRERDYLKQIHNGRYHILYTFVKRPFSTSFLCMDTHDIKPVLVKIYSKRSGEDKYGNTFFDRGKNEAEIASLLSKSMLTPNVADVYEDTYFYYIVSEYIVGDTYADLSKDLRIQTLPMLLEKVQQMHDLGIVHRDLKLSNVMVSPKGLYLIDLEIAARTGSENPFPAGTDNYIPPEGLGATALPSYDSFSLGSCIIHSYVGVDPACLPADPQVRINAVEAYIPSKTLTIIKALYDIDPAKRPSAQECIEYIATPEKKRVSVPAEKKELLSAKIDSLINDGIKGLQQFEQEDANTISWQSKHQTAQAQCRLGLNTGIGGVLLGLLSVIHTKDDKESYHPTVRKAVSYIRTHAEEIENLPGLFTGMAGSALAVSAVYIMFGNKDDLELSYELLKTASERNNNYDLFSGYSGIAYVAVRIFQSTRDNRFLDIARTCVDILINEKEFVGGVTAWKVKKSEETPRYETGASHGTAGIALAIALYGIECQSDEHMQFAIRCLQEIYVDARSPERSILHHDLGQYRNPTINKNWCHGASGYLWVMAQLPQAFDYLEDEISWAISACASISHLSNPTYCHGMAGSLELWRLVNSTTLRNEVTERCYNNTLYELSGISQEHNGLQLFSSENTNVFSPDLWVGFMGTVSSLALAVHNSPSTILNTKW